jgi:toxin ParE1/3/4
VPNRQLFVHPLAEAEIEASARWYDNRSHGLGGIFIAAVREATKRVMEAPKRWRMVNGTRRYLMGRFPFAIVYRELSDDNVEIVAVAHLKRRHRNWSQRR